MSSNKENSYPKLHFAPKYGWINDPNGLVYHDGIYELYYQNNPHGVQWDDMTWGHAKSMDLMHWEELEPALFPDENGLMYSGSGFKNEQKLLDLPEDALLFPYTAAKFEKNLHKPHFTIRMAVSTDGGVTLEKREGKILDEMAPDNRDPKVFWHEATKAYILVLWIEDYDFGIFRSEDLEYFQLSQRITLDGGFECPDLFELSVRDDQGKETGKKWVFWAADGMYVVGDFDGYKFSPSQRKRFAYFGSKLPYAAQTWSGDPKGRTLQIAWLRTNCINNTTTGTMSLPRDLSLVKKDDSYILKQDIPEELLNAKKHLGSASAGDCLEIPEDGAVCMHVESLKSLSLSLLGEGNEEIAELSFDSSTGNLVVKSGIVSEFLGFGRNPIDKMDIIYDRGILEMTAENSTILQISDIPQLRDKICKAVKITSSEKEVKLGIIS